MRRITCPIGVASADIDIPSTNHSEMNTGQVGAASISRKNPSKPATAPPAPPNSVTCKRRCGISNAITIDPAPHAPSSTATSDSERPSCPRTSTTVFTSTSAVGAASARFNASTPRSSGRRSIITMPSRTRRDTHSRLSTPRLPEPATIVADPTKPTAATANTWPRDANDNSIAANTGLKICSRS